MELIGGANFPRSLRKVTSLETLRDETAQMRRVREKEARTLSHFESLASEIGEWSWKGASVRENSLYAKDASFVKKHLVDSSAAIDIETFDGDYHQLPPLLPFIVEPSFRQSPHDGALQSIKRTSGDDITSIRRAMQAISHKTASLFALTELARSDSASALSALTTEGKRTRYSRLLRQGDALVEQAIHHMERAHQSHEKDRTIINK